MAATTTTHEFRTVMRISLAWGRMVKVTLTEFLSVDSVKTRGCFIFSKINASGDVMTTGVRFAVYVRYIHAR